MSIVTRQLDGQSFSFSISLPDTFVDVLSVNIVTGDVTSAYLPVSWTRWIENNVALVNSVVPPLDRTSVSYLARLVNVGPMDDSLFVASSVMTATNVYSLRMTQVAGIDPACLLVGLPHSITGGFGYADGATGLAPPVILGGDVVGPSGTNALVAFGPGAVTKGAADKSAVVTTDGKGRVFALTETSIQITEAQVTSLVGDLAAKADKVITISAGSGLTGGGDLTANRTIAMPNVGTPGTYGSASVVPVLTTDAQGRVTNVVNTPISTATLAAVAAQFSDTTDQPLTAGVPRVAQFNTTDYSAGGITVALNGSGFPTRLTVPVTGLYSFTISPQLLHTGGTTVEIIFWGRINGINIPSSSSRFEMGNNNNQTLPFLELIVPLTAGQYFEWVFYTAGVNTSLEYFSAVVGPPAIPATPSVIAGVKLIGT